MTEPTKEKANVPNISRNTDKLTGLYLREPTFELIKNTIVNNKDIDYLILYFDVKDFKIVNDVYGSDFGDMALKKIANWIRTEFSDKADVIGRLSGDTFVVCLPEDKFDDTRVDKGLVNFSVSKDDMTQYFLIHVGAYSVSKEEKDDPNIAIILDRARMALSTIKDQYQIHIAHYNKQIREDLLWEQKISGELENAIVEKQIVPFLQPIADSNGKIVGAEALVRWIHPQKGYMPPSKFIPIFEKNGMISEVDKYMWNAVCEILKQWEKENRDYFISVNISPLDFYGMDVSKEIKEIVKKHGVNPHKLRLEITETVMMVDAENRFKKLNELRDAGFIVEMDDFGSGYSSLNLLKDMPVDVIKIDMVFLYNTKNSEKARTIVQNIIDLSKTLGMCSLSEGVETKRQYEVLNEMGCELFQGYYFSKPLPKNMFEEKFFAV